MPKSFATEKTDYVSIQLRRSNNGTIHIQGAGIGTNRNYGFADDFKVDSDFYTWLDTVPTPNKSLYPGSKQVYVVAQANANRWGDKIHIQIGADVNFNRSYGAVLEIPIEGHQAFADFVNINQGVVEQDTVATPVDTFEEVDGTCCNETCCDDEADENELTLTKADIAAIVDAINENFVALFTARNSK